MSELMYCPHCNKSYKTPRNYYNHVDTCTDSPERQKLLTDVASVAETIETARLTSKSLPEFLHVVSTSMLTLGITMNIEYIPVLQLREKGYGYKTLLKLLCLHQLNY